MLSHDGLMCHEVVSSTLHVGDWGILFCHVDGAEGGEESRCEGGEYNTGLEALAGFLLWICTDVSFTVDNSRFFEIKVSLPPL